MMPKINKSIQNRYKELFKNSNTQSSLTDKWPVRPSNVKMSQPVKNS